LHFTPLMMFGTAGQWTDMPAAVTELMGTSCRARVNTEGYTQCMSSIEVIGAGSGSAVIRAEYTLDLTGAAGWAALVGSNMAISATGVKVTSWADLPSAARDREILVRMVGESGDGAADPALGRAWIGLR
jgi:hypothetical protein